MSSQTFILSIKLHMDFSMGWVFNLFSYEPPLFISLNSNFSNNIEKCSKILGFSQNKSLDQAVSEHINKLVPFGEGIIHGINIAGTPLNDTNDIIIKVININGNNWYRVVIYDCQSSSIHTITNIAGSWSNWITIS